MNHKIKTILALMVIFVAISIASIHPTNESSAQAQGNLVDFETPSLGGQDWQILDPYVDANTGVTFTVLPRGWGDEVVGLVKNSYTSACVEPADNNQKLGTGRATTTIGDIGRAGFGIKATFAETLTAPVIISAEFQAGADVPVRITLFDESDNQVASFTQRLNPPNGTCGFPGEPRARANVFVRSYDPVAYAILEAIDEPDVPGSPVFVIDNFKFEPFPLTAPAELDVSRITQGLDIDVTGGVFYDLIAGKDTLIRTQLYSRAQLRQVVSATCRMQAITYIIGPFRIPIPGHVENIPADPFPERGLLNAVWYGFFNGSQVFDCWVPGNLIPHPGDYLFEIEVTIDGDLEPTTIPLGTRTFSPTDDLRVLLYRWQLPTNDPNFRNWDTSLDNTIPRTMDEVQRLLPLQAGTGGVDFVGNSPRPGLRYTIFPNVFQCTASRFDPDLTLQELIEACDAITRSDANQAILSFNSLLQQMETQDGLNRDRFDWGMVLASVKDNRGGQSCHFPQRTAGGEFDGRPWDASVIAHELAHCMGQVASQSPHSDGHTHSSNETISTPLGLSLVNMRLHSDIVSPRSLMFPTVIFSNITSSEGWEWNELRRFFRTMNSNSANMSDVEANMSANSASNSHPLFLLRGLINQADTISVNYSARHNELDLELTPANPDGIYALVFFDENNTELDRFRFQPIFSDVDMGTVSITDLFLIVQLPENSKRFEIQKEGEIIYNETFSMSAPSITNMIASGDDAGQVTLQWEASDPDSDNLAYTIFLEIEPGQPPFLLAGGLKDTTYLFNTASAPATTTGRLIVEASDGYNTVSVNSNAFTIEAKPPLVTISEPNDLSAAISGQLVNFVGAGYDYTDGILSDEALTWISDIDGVLGTGKYLAAFLSSGTHKITLQAVALSGLISETNIQIDVLVDSDADGLSDEYEAGFGCLLPLIYDSDRDTDNDNLLPMGERAWGTNPCVPDTDNDGFNDGDEVRLGSDPSDDQSTPLPELLTVSTYSVNLGECNNPNSRTVDIQSTSIYTWTAIADTDWLTVTDGDANNDSITISAQCRGLGIGTYTGRILISAVDSQPQITEVILNVPASVVPPSIYLPIVANNFTSAPDLIVNEVTVTNNDALVCLQNDGNAPVLSPFWVDLYIDPIPVPTGPNQIWSDGRSRYGLVWGVTTELLTGEELCLSMNDDYFWPILSNFPEVLPADTTIYVQVDSANVETSFGNVHEIHEILGEEYNNIVGPLLSVSNNSLIERASPAVINPAKEENAHLPHRPN